MRLWQIIANFLDLERITSNFEKKRLSLLGCVYVLHKNIALANFTSLMRKIRQSNIPKTGCTCMAVLCCCCCLRQDLFYFTSSLPSSLQLLKLPNYDMWVWLIFEISFVHTFLGKLYSDLKDTTSSPKTYRDFQETDSSKGFSYK